MTKFLSSIKADLLDRRILPILALLAVALLAAITYAVLGSGGSTPATAPAASPATPAASAGIPVSQAKVSATRSVAETTNGSSTQHAETSRNPFAPLPSAASKSASSSTSGASASGSSGSSASGSTGSSTGSGSGSSTGSGSGSASQGSGESTPPAKKETSTPAKPKTVYSVTVVFGTAPAGTPPLAADLPSFANLKRQQPLPSAKQPLIVFRGVIAGGKSASFTLVGEAILRGGAACLPSASQCQAIDLKVGQSEELEYLPLGGTAVVYQLRVVSIDSSKATEAQAGLAFRSQSKGGVELLHNSGLGALHGLRYSETNGVLVFAGHRAFSARAHPPVRGASPKL